jgi:ubiquinone/menaquinone biosynthesis C-methylase UbiE
LGASPGGDQFLDAPRGRDGIFRRLPSVDAESHQAFLTDFRTWVQASPQGLHRAAQVRAGEILAANGYQPTDDVPMEKVIALMEKDPIVMASARAWMSAQQQMWKHLVDTFHGKRDYYLSELRKGEKRGPGSLELSPTMTIPEYAKHEIHAQPGGYVGDPLAGYVYHYGTNNFFLGHNTQDQNQKNIATVAPLPADRKVRRILDIGCSCGQLTVALKDRFPEAEVWGVDVGGPMVHYAHMRAADLGANVNFRQALAESTGFPDGHFDMVVSYIILHEVPNKQNDMIMKEVARVLRPGGTYYPVDFFTSSPPPKEAYGKFRRWWDHRWNNEPWALEHMNFDLAGSLTRHGMKVDLQGPTSRPGGKANLTAVKV